MRIFSVLAWMIGVSCAPLTAVTAPAPLPAPPPATREIEWVKAMQAHDLATLQALVPVLTQREGTLVSEQSVILMSGDYWPEGYEFLREAKVSPSFGEFHLPRIIAECVLDERWRDYFRRTPPADEVLARRAVYYAILYGPEYFAAIQLAGFPTLDRAHDLLFAAIRARNPSVLRSALALQPDDRFVDEALDEAVRRRYAAGIRLLDRGGQHDALVAEIEAEYPPQADLPVLGTWRGRSPTGARVILRLNPDASGYIVDGEVYTPLAWRSKETGVLALWFVDLDPPAERLTVRYQANAPSTLLVRGAAPGGIELTRVRTDP